MLGLRVPARIMVPIRGGSAGARSRPREAQEVARRAGAPCFLVRAVCEPETMKERLRRRASNEGAISDGRPEILDRQIASFDHAETGDSAEGITVDTADAASDSIQPALQGIYKALL